MEKEQITSKNLSTIVERLTSLENALNFPKMEDTLTLQARIQQIAAGVFDDPTEFLEDNPSLKDQILILTDIIFPEAKESTNKLTHTQALENPSDRNCFSSNSCYSPRESEEEVFVPRVPTIFSGYETRRRRSSGNSCSGGSGGHSSGC